MPETTGKKDPTGRTRPAAPSELAEGRPASMGSAGDFPPSIKLLPPSPPDPTPDQALWAAIKNRTSAIGFKPYREFLHRVFCETVDPYPDERETAGQLQAKLTEKLGKSPLILHGVNAYQLLKTATECFLILECGVDIKGSKDGTGRVTDDSEYLGMETGRFSYRPVQPPLTAPQLMEYLTQYIASGSSLPYLQRIIDNLKLETHKGEDDYSPFCGLVYQGKLSKPCLLELIWSYWHEEGMLVQAINALSLRFQNKRGPGGKEPLAQLEIDPLRPMANLLWGYIQDEPHRLTIARRSYEYSHHYGLSLLGRAAPKLRPADARSKFLEAFHMLLHRTWAFYQEAADTTVIPEGFPLLNALKEVHMLLAEGAHNQFGDLPWTARVEMLIQQWLLSRKEIQEFLRGRAMVPYREGWMSQVDTMKKLQGWTDTPVTHFRDLGVFGEQILLSVRYGDWSEVESEDNAKNWALYWKPEIQSYLHAYRAVTGVDLTNPDRLDSTPPAIHLRKRLARQAAAVR